MSLLWFSTNTHAQCNGTSAKTTEIKNLLAQTLFHVHEHYNRVYGSQCSVHAARILRACRNRTHNRPHVESTMQALCAVVSWHT